MVGKKTFPTNIKMRKGQEGGDMRSSKRLEGRAGVAGGGKGKG